MPSRPSAPADGARTRYLAAMATGALAGLLLYVIARLSNLPSGRDPGLRDVLAAVASLTAWKLALVAAGAGAGAWLASGKWTPLGAGLYLSLIATVAGFILYSATVSFPRNPSPLNGLLFAAECVSLLFVVIYAYYTIDRTSRVTWARHYQTQPFRPTTFPRVAVHVPTFNEDPHAVMDVLERLLRLDYPEDRYHVVVCDDSTDEAARRELEAFCREQAPRIRYLRRPDRAGFKAGALNHALRQEDPAVAFIAVVDADYLVDPSYLKETLGFFEENPHLGFLQTPQDFHNVDHSPFTRQVYRANRYFYDAVMPARNEANSIIFCGTMGIVRRRALEEAGGWGEDTLTEDSETSVRIMALGWQSLYVPRVYGRGLLPRSYAAYKKQQYRWAFGGAQILRKHALRLGTGGRLTLRQRWDILTGGLHYFSGAVIVLIAAILLLMGASEVYGWHGFVSFHRGEVFFMGFVPLFLTLEGILRMRWAMGTTMGLTLRETLQVMAVWFSTTFFTSLAALRAMAGSREGFVRTPKHPERKVGALVACRRAIALMRFEATAAWLLLVTGLGVLLLAVRDVPSATRSGVADLASSLMLAFWLLWYAYVFACGPLVAFRGSRGPA